MKTIRYNETKNDFQQEQEIKQQRKASQQFRNNRKSRKSLWSNFGE